MSSNNDPVASLISDAKVLLADTDDSNPFIDEKVWKGSVKQALLDLSRYKPLKRRATLQLQANAVSVALPADFQSFDETCLNESLEGYGLRAVVYGYYFGLEFATQASSYMPGFPPIGANSPFQAGTKLRVLDDGAGGKEMFIQPAVKSNASWLIFYLATHQVKAAVASTGDDDPGTPAVNTVSDSLRDVLVMRICYHACLATSVEAAGDKDQSARFEVLAAKFNTQYEDRTRFRPFGAMG